MDLIRSILQYEKSCAHLTDEKSWETYSVAIFGHILSSDISNPDDKVTQNYHLVCLKVLCNMYQTQCGIECFKRETHLSE